MNVFFMILNGKDVLKKIFNVKLIQKNIKIVPIENIGINMRVYSSLVKRSDSKSDRM